MLAALTPGVFAGGETRPTLLSAEESSQMQSAVLSIAESAARITSRQRARSRTSSKRILTIEDLTEEVIGEISDEHDLDVNEAVSVGDDEWTLPGDVHLDEVERLIGHELSRDDAETIAGLIISTHGDLPPEGAVVPVDLPEKASETVQGLRIHRWLEVEVTAVERHVPSQLIVRLHQLDQDADPPLPEPSQHAVPAGDRDGEETR